MVPAIVRPAPGKDKARRLSFANSREQPVPSPIAMGEHRPFPRPPQWERVRVREPPGSGGLLPVERQVRA